MHYRYFKLELHLSLSPKWVSIHLKYRFHTGINGSMKNFTIQTFYSTRVIYSGKKALRCLKCYSYKKKRSLKNWFWFCGQPKMFLLWHHCQSYTISFLEPLFLKEYRHLLLLHLYLLFPPVEEWLCKKWGCSYKACTYVLRRWQYLHHTDATQS